MLCAFINKAELVDNWLISRCSLYYPACAQAFSERTSAEVDGCKNARNMRSKLWRPRSSALMLSTWTFASSMCKNLFVFRREIFPAIFIVKTSQKNSGGLADTRGCANALLWYLVFGGAVNYHHRLDWSRGPCGRNIGKHRQQEDPLLCLRAASRFGFARSWPAESSHCVWVT